MDSIDTFKVPLDSMKQTIGTLRARSTKSQSYLSRYARRRQSADDPAATELSL